MLDGAEVFKDLHENTWSQAQKSKANRHVDHCCYPEANVAPKAKIRNVIRCFKNSEHKRNEKDDSRAGLIKCKQEERLHVMIPHTITNPRTVMVHSWHTDATVLAMVTPLWLPCSAVIAYFFRLSFCYLWHLSWLLQRRCPVTQHSEPAAPIKEKFVNGSIHFIGHPFIHFIVGDINWANIEEANNETH